MAFLSSAINWCLTERPVKFQFIELLGKTDMHKDRLPLHPKRSFTEVTRMGAPNYPSISLSGSSRRNSSCICASTTARVSAQLSSFCSSSSEKIRSDL